MQIDIREIPSFWMTCEKTAGRWPVMENTLQKVEVKSTKCVGPITNPYTIGVAAEYLRVLKENLAPIFFLEDDARLTKYYTSPILSVPDGADGFWIGTSLYSRQNGQTTLGGAILRECEDNSCFRVSGLLSLHAFIVLTEKYRLHLIDLLSNFEPVGGVDDIIAERQADYEIYALKYPLFYQNDGRSEFATQTPLAHL